MAPPDDMWGAFADAGEPYSLHVDEEPVGYCAVDRDGVLVGFFVTGAARHREGPLLDQVVARLGVTVARPATYDPGFLGPCLDRARATSTLAIVYDWAAEPDRSEGVRLVPAQRPDLERLISFNMASTGAERGFLEGYLATRVARGEIWIHERDGSVAAIGEARIPPTDPSVSHLGVVVAPSWRLQGLGAGVLRALVDRAAAAGRAPWCSTAPHNHGAQRAIERAGFRPRHRVLSVHIA